MDTTLNGGDIALCFECLGWSKKSLSEQPIDPDMPDDLRKDQLAMRDEKLARIEALMAKLRSIRDES
jgi:hypothetical protein